ncbi:hypothetical protein BAOM_2076 [Peribacillus asahii]|uniref:DUF4352 domain-containing protein n=1 Tax=Peribacillus asahii TaxID=228899 RepID=A0A3Q9RNB5_9BACI|nr:hypothetical protein [Peribacillus asahii]AZV42685.1 hypothetical protein BAOM_2076 [Peribacillus asahii]
MKKFLLMGMTALLALGLAACGEENTQSSTEPKEDPKPAEQKEVSNKPEKTENGDIVFTKAGQKGEVDGGTLELLKIKNVNETIDISPLKVTVKEIKLFKKTDMDEATKEAYKMYNDGKAIGDELIYVQVSYDAENLEEKNIGWNSLLNAVTDKGQQIDVDMNDMIYTDSDGSSEFLGKVTKEYTDGFVVKDADISKIKFVWGSTYDTDSYENITEEQQVEYSF